MLNTFCMVCCSLSLYISLASCNKTNVRSATPVTKQINNSPQVSDKMKIKIGGSTFIVILEDSPTTIAFKSLLPLNVNMADLNRNEKHVDLPRKLPTDASNPGTIHAGDLMLYGSSTLVLFYKTFSTTYSYTRIGRIVNIEGLTPAIGTGNVLVTFEMER